MLFYNFDAVPGAYVSYNAVISVDWKADSNDQWTVPFGLSIGRIFDMGDGNGLNDMVGPYFNVVRSDGAADWSASCTVSWLFP